MVVPAGTRMFPKLSLTVSGYVYVGSNSLTRGSVAVVMPGIGFGFSRLESWVSRYPSQNFFKSPFFSIALSLPFMDSIASCSWMSQVFPYLPSSSACKGVAARWKPETKSRANKLRNFITTPDEDMPGRLGELKVKISPGGGLLL